MLSKERESFEHGIVGPGAFIRGEGIRSWQGLDRWVDVLSVRNQLVQYSQDRSWKYTPYRSKNLLPKDSGP